MRCTAEILYLQHQLLFVVIISEKKISTEPDCHWCACDTMQYRQCLVHSRRIYRKCRRNESLQQIGQREVQWEMYHRYPLWTVLSPSLTANGGSQVLHSTHDDSLCG